jgi:hypothetical protein
MKSDTFCDIVQSSRFSRVDQEPTEKFVVPLIAFAAETSDNLQRLDRMRSSSFSKSQPLQAAVKVTNPICQVCRGSGVGEPSTPGQNSVVSARERRAAPEPCVSALLGQAFQQITETSATAAKSSRNAER